MKNNAIAYRVNEAQIYAFLSSVGTVSLDVCAWCGENRPVFSPCRKGWGYPLGKCGCEDTAMSFESMNKPENCQIKYEDFQCKRCGRCCTGEGFINISQEEGQRIADHLHISVEEFNDKYTKYKDGHDRWLIDGVAPEGGEVPCIFLEYDENGLSGCRVHGVAKPKQCSTFPIQWRIPGFENWCAAFEKDK